MLPKLRIDIVVHDETGQSLVSAIVKAVGRGTIGDGEIWGAPWTLRCASGLENAIATPYEGGH